MFFRLKRFVVFLKKIITSRVILGEGGEETFYYRHVFLKLCNMHTQTHRLSCRISFSGSFAIFFLMFTLHEFFFLFELPPPPFHFSNGASLKECDIPEV